MNSEDTRSQIERIVREVLEERLGDRDRRITINVSARHCHIRQDHLEVLFGPGAQLTKYRDLMQPGEFAAEQTVTLVGPNRRVFEQVRILGPVRKITQVELSFTDGRYLGMDLPPRMSGDIAGTLPGVLIGTHGSIRIEEGIIRALRHMHIGEDEAEHLGLRNGTMASVRTDGPMGLTFDHVLVRAGKNARREMHVDTDEGNAAGLISGLTGTIL